MSFKMVLFKPSGICLNASPLDRPLLIDPSSSARHATYADLIRFLLSIPSVPDTIGLVRPFEFLASVTAGLIRNASFCLTDHRSLATSEIIPADCAGLESQLTDHRSAHGSESFQETWLQLYRDLPDLILNSTGRIQIETSGTTGEPKRIEHSITTLARAVQRSHQHESDVWGLAYLPTKFAGVQVFLQGICNRNSFVRLFNLNAADTAAAIHQHAVTHLSATPTFLRLLIGGKQTFPHVKRVTTGGEICSELLVEQITTAFPNARFRNVYASTESGSLFYSDGDHFIVPPYLRPWVRIHQNELILHQSLVAEGMKDFLIGAEYFTGDLVEIVAEEPLTLRILGRGAEQINVGGMKVNPHDVEKKLLKMAGIKEARVYGRANSVCGHLVCAQIVVDQEATLQLDRIRADLRGLLPAYAVPRIIEVVPSIDITSNGKKGRTA
jgi:acyl-CoA synthetase (AMP-forming)/AMP-acid ligase II